MEIVKTLQVLSKHLGPLDIRSDLGGDKCLVISWKDHSISLLYRENLVEHLSIEPIKVGPSFTAKTLEELELALEKLKSVYLFKLENG
jgi:hypothetical protein